MANAKRLSSKEMRRLKRQGLQNGAYMVTDSTFSMNRVQPRTENQAKAKDLYNDDQHLVLCGTAGTGKTFLALGMAMEDVMDAGSPYEKVVMIRSTVQTRDQGHMPGGPKEKAEMFEDPYVGIFTELFDRDDAINVVKQKGQFVFKSTSFLRGTSFSNCIVIVDECQSCTYHELDTIITRIGVDAKLIMCGDVKQDDLKGSRNRNDKSGLMDFMEVVKRMPSMSIVEFGPDDILRSDFIREYILAKEEVGI